MLCSEQSLETRMNGAIEGAKIFASMADHRPRKGGPGFGGDFHRAGDEKLVVWKHWENVERPILLRKATADRLPNVQHRMSEARKTIRSYFSALIKLMSPLHSSRATFTFARSSSPS